LTLGGDRTGGGGGTDVSVNNGRVLTFVARSGNVLTEGAGGWIDLPYSAGVGVLNKIGAILTDTKNGYFVIINTAFSYRNAFSTDHAIFWEGQSPSYIGVAQASVSRGDAVSVLLSGYSAYQSGLLSGNSYNVVSNGGLVGATVPASQYVVAISDTEIIV